MFKERRQNLDLFWFILLSLLPIIKENTPISCSLSYVFMK